MKFIEELKNQKYIKAYSETKLIEKIIKFAKNAGIKVIYVALLLFYTLQKTTTPAWAKSTIIGALGYFILPVDIIPDILPIAGFSDDITALLAVVVAVALYVDEDIKTKAKAKLRIWFESYDEVELKEVDDKIQKN
jgi:uncharacterized membrane protein YkvA (DUF1232 family)